MARRADPTVATSAAEAIWRKIGGVHRAVSRRHLTSVVVAVAVLLALPATFGAGGGPNAADNAVATRVASTFGDDHPVLTLFAVLSTTIVVLPMLLLAAGHALVRLRSIALTIGVILGPSVAVALNSFVLKPLIHRPLDDYLAYPSGHTVSLVATITTIALLTRRKTVVVVIGVVVLICAGIGMIGLGYHHLTDIIGGACVGIAVPVVVFTILEASTLGGDIGSRADRRG